jgi:hypothetical protein
MYTRQDCGSSIAFVGGVTSAKRREWPRSGKQVGSAAGRVRAV